MLLVCGMPRQCAWESGERGDFAELPAGFPVSKAFGLQLGAVLVEDWSACLSAEESQGRRESGLVCGSGVVARKALLVTSDGQWEHLEATLLRE